MEQALRQSPEMSWVAWFKEQLMEPVRAMRMAYLPFLMVYFAYGLTGIVGIASDFWVMEVLQFKDYELQLAAFWMGVPWALKMLFGQFVDARPIMGSPRRAYIFVGAALVALGYALLAGLAGKWPALMEWGTPLNIFYLANVVIVVGLVIQDVTADAMTSEMNSGDERDARSIQVLGRLAMGVGGLIAALCAGTVGMIGREQSYESVFYIACAVPFISVAGAIFWKQKQVLRARWNQPILVGGFAFAVFVSLVHFLGLPMRAEIVWVGNAIAIAAFFWVLAKELDKETLLSLLAVGVVYFIFRAMPSAGPGVGWWQKEALGFDEDFLGRLQTIGSVLGLLGLILAARSLRNYSVAPVLVFVTVVGTILYIPVIGMYYGLHHWTEAHLGFGARTIAIIDVAISSPFGDLTAVPMLALLAMIARLGNPATWFAVGASFLNFALSTSSITTKWLTQWLPVSQIQRGKGGEILAQADYSNLGTLMIISAVLGFAVPLLAIWMFRKRLDGSIAPVR